MNLDQPWLCPSRVHCNERNLFCARVAPAVSKLLLHRLVDLIAPVGVPALSQGHSTPRFQTRPHDLFRARHIDEPRRSFLSKFCEESLARLAAQERPVQHDMASPYGKRDALVRSYTRTPDDSTHHRRSDFHRRVDSPLYRCSDIELEAHARSDRRSSSCPRPPARRPSPATAPATSQKVRAIESLRVVKQLVGAVVKSRENCVHSQLC
jgi:hypothetical protein